MDWSTKVVLVTGGARGIGAAIVSQAARRGAAVVFSYEKNGAAADQLVQDIRAAGGKALAVRGDVASSSFAPAFFDAALQEYGRVSDVVNNAGITGRIGSFRDLPLEILRRTIDVNLVGTAVLCQESLRRWRKAGQAGNIVNITSVASTLGAPHEYVHYAASKAAVEALTIGLAKEFASEGVRVNAVSPGTTRTEIHAAGGDPGRLTRVAARVPMGRVAEPSEIANAVLWLLSDEASYVNGAILRATGGL